MTMATSTRELSSYGFAFACVAVSSLCANVVYPHAQLADLAMIHLLGVVVLSLRSSVRTSFVASIVSNVAFDFFFIRPRFTFAWTDVEASLTFAATIIVALVVSTLSENLRRQERAARATAFRAEALYELNVELSSVSDSRQLAAVTARHLEKLFFARVAIWLQGPDGALEQATNPRDAEFAERAWARREFTKQEGPAGASIWVPVVGTHSSLGVIRIEPKETFEEDSKSGFLLSACANQFATALERVQLANAVHRTQIEAETERMRSSLLSAVSHDLKTPLATMIAAGTTLIAQRAQLPAETMDELLRSIVGEGERLNGLIYNLLSVTRMESPNVELRRTPEAIEDVINSATERFSARQRKDRIETRLDADLPLVFAEPLLIEQVVVNLLENAIRYAGTDARILVQASASGSTMTVQVADDGPGISEHERSKVFEKFYRGGARKSDGGVGLGLTICRTIVHAHGGRISIRERAGGGTLVEFTLPLAGRSEQFGVEAALPA